MPIIVCDQVSKIFRRQTGARLLRQHLREVWNKKAREEGFYALRKVSFQVEHGESVALVGSNGAGKSTLLSLVSGLSTPDEGSIQVNGRVAALMELGSGFHPDLTGTENLRLNAALLGFTRKQTDDLFDTIVEFSGVGKFIDQPLRTFSSGMALRLAFSIAVNLNPDVLVLDEVLAVGDQYFQAKCVDRIHELRQSGKTLLFVSHSVQSVRTFCDRALWIEHGEVVLEGPAGRVIDAYVETGQAALAGQA